MFSQSTETSCQIVLLLIILMKNFKVLVVVEIYAFRSSHGRFKIESFGASYSLAISSLCDSDAGLYECELIGTSATSSTTSCTLSRDSCTSMQKKIARLMKSSLPEPGSSQPAKLEQQPMKISSQCDYASSTHSLSAPLACEL